MTTRARSLSIRVLGRVEASRDGRIAEVWLFPQDQALENELFA